MSSQTPTFRFFGLVLDIVVGVIVFYAVRWIRNVGRKISRFNRDRRCEKVSHRIHVLIYSHLDAEETAAAYVHALKRQDGPTALILSRQDLPILPGTAAEKRAAAGGTGTRFTFHTEVF